MRTEPVSALAKPDGPNLLQRTNRRVARAAKAVAHWTFVDCGLMDDYAIPATLAVLCAPVLLPMLLFDRFMSFCRSPRVKAFFFGPEDE